MTIDWTKPLEAYHPDGHVREVTPDDEDWPASDGTYWADELTGWFNADGTPINSFDPWRIRNRTEKPALTEEMVREVAGVRWVNVVKLLREHGVLAEPVDRDLELARTLMHCDDEFVILEAIKRVRAENG